MMSLYMSSDEVMKIIIEKALDKLLQEDAPVKMAKNRNYTPCHNRRKRNNANPCPPVLNPVQFFTSMYR